MKICFVIQDITRKNGTERVTVNLSNLFSEKGHDVTILSVFKEGKDNAFCLNDGVKIVYLSSSTYNINRGLVDRFFSALKSLRKLYVFLKKNIRYSPIILISQGFFCSFLLWLCGYSSKVIACEHFKYELYSRPFRLIRNLIYRNFAKVVVLTDKDRLRFQRHLPNGKVVTIPNMTVLNSTYLPNLDTKKIISVGRLHYQKGFDLLVKAMVPVIRKHPDWTLSIFGDGDLKENLNSLIVRLGLDKNVYLQGQSDNIYNEYQQSSIFVLSSRYEGFGMVLLEALCLGIPSVAFDCPEGPADLLSYGGGLLIENGNVDKLSEGILCMIENKQLRIDCSQNRYKVIEKYSSENIYKQWILVLRELNKKCEKQYSSDV